MFLDPNKLSEEGIASLGSSAWSENGNYFAYAVQMGGSDWSTIYVRDGNTKQDLDDKLEWVKFSSIAWTKDEAGFFYSRFDDPDVDNLAKAAQNTEKLEFQKVYYHFVGTDQSEDQLIYENKEQPDYTYGVATTDDGRYVVISTMKNTDDISLVSVADIFGGLDPEEKNELEFKKIIPEWIGGFNLIHNYDEKFLFKTNYDAPMGRVIMIDINKPEKEHWVELIPENEEEPL